jgi:hypothetical protein
VATIISFFPVDNEGGMLRRFSSIRVSRARSQQHLDCPFESRSVSWDNGKLRLRSSRDGL